MYKQKKWGNVQYSFTCQVWTTQGDTFFPDVPPPGQFFSTSVQNYEVTFAYLQEIIFWWLLGPCPGRVASFHMLDSFTGLSRLEYTSTTGGCCVFVPDILIVRESWLMRSCTQLADIRASASWSQHSSILEHNVVSPYKNKFNIKCIQEVK